MSNAQLDNELKSPSESAFTVSIYRNGRRTRAKRNANGRTESADTRARFAPQRKMLPACGPLPAAICMACLIFCCTACSPDIGQPLDLNQVPLQLLLLAPVLILQRRFRRDLNLFLIARSSRVTFRVPRNVIAGLFMIGCLCEIDE